MSDPTRQIGEAVAWRVKDYADGWILFHNEAPARKSGEARNGALVQPLIPASDLSTTTRQRDEAVVLLGLLHYCGTTPNALAARVEAFLASLTTVEDKP